MGVFARGRDAVIECVLKRLRVEAAGRADGHDSGVAALFVPGMLDRDIHALAHELEHGAARRLVDAGDDALQR